MPRAEPQRARSACKAEVAPPRPYRRASGAAPHARSLPNCCSLCERLKTTWRAARHERDARRSAAAGGGGVVLRRAAQPRARRRVSRMPPGAVRCSAATRLCCSCAAASLRRSTCLCVRVSLCCCHARARQERAAREAPRGTRHRGASLTLIARLAAIRRCSLRCTFPDIGAALTRRASPLRHRLAAVRRAAHDRARAGSGPRPPRLGADAASLGVGHPHLAGSCGRLPRGAHPRRALLFSALTWHLLL